MPGVVAALLFGIHPLHVESVAWVSERKVVLSTLFMLLSALFYIWHAEFAKKGSRGGNWALSLSCFALALMSKPMPLMLPLVFLLLDVYPLKRLTLQVRASDRLEEDRGMLRESGMRQSAAAGGLPAKSG